MVIQEESRSSLLFFKSIRTNLNIEISLNHKDLNILVENTTCHVNYSEILVVDSMIHKIITQLVHMKIIIKIWFCSHTIANSALYSYPWEVTSRSLDATSCLKEASRVSLYRSNLGSTCLTLLM